MNIIVPILVQSPTPERPIDEAHNALRREDYDNYVEDEDYDDYGEEDENLLPHRHAVARSAMNITTSTNVHPCFANDTHVSFLCPCKVFVCDFENVPCITILMSALFISG